MLCDDVSLKRLSPERLSGLKRAKPGRFNASRLQRFNAFALYEVLLGITIFALGVIALGHAVENCLNASTINAEEGVPDDAKEFKVDSNYGAIKVVQKTAAAELTEPDNTLLNGIYLVTLSAQWQLGSIPQSKQIQFYVYRPG